MAHAVSINGISVYNLSAGKTLPQWQAAAKKRSLKKEVDFRRRIELIQDFGFPSAAQTVCVSGDGRYIVATGTYPPRVRVFDTTELSMKFERFMDATPVAMACVSDDYTKLAFLQDDRNVELHAGYGRHFRTRIPTFGRDMVYHAPTAELVIASACSDIYRLNLEEGRFMAPLVAAAPGGDRSVHAVAVSRVTALIAAAEAGGLVELWDPRALPRAVARLLVPDAAGAADATGGGPDATSVAFDEGSLSLAVGTADGRALVFDLRSARPAVTKQHQYGTPVHTVRFHRGGAGGGGSGGAPLVLSADRAGVKLWGRTDGASFTNIEAPAAVADVCICPDRPAVGGADSGLLFVAGEWEEWECCSAPWWRRGRCCSEKWLEAGGEP